jgi:LacI family transcriptional regulator
MAFAIALGRGLGRRGSEPTEAYAALEAEFTELYWVQAPDPRRRPDAVIAANDLLAFGVMRAAHNGHPRVPQQPAVVGIDDTRFARVFSPSPTSASLGARRRGHEAARLLLERMDAPTAPPRTAYVEPRLVVRESDAPVTPRSTS